MHPRGSATKALLLTLLALLTVLLAGCGGGGDQSGTSERNQDRGARKGAGVDAPENKIAIGTVKNVRPEKGRLILNQSRGGRMSFKVVRGAVIMLDGEKVDLANVERGQQAQVRYIVRNERNRVQEVDVFSGG